MGVLRFLGGIACKLSGVIGTQMDPCPELEPGPVGFRAVSDCRTVHRGGFCQTQDGGADGREDRTSSGPYLLHTFRESGRCLRTHPAGCAGDMVQVQKN